MRSDFGVLSATAADEEDLPAIRDLAGDAATQTAPATGSLHLAQTIDDVRVLVDASGDEICLFTRVPAVADGGGCAPLETAAAAGTPMMSMRDYPASAAEQQTTERQGAALFPDGTSDIELTSPAGTVRHLPLVNNTIAFIGGPDETLSWTAYDGTRHSAHFMH